MVTSLLVSLVLCGNGALPAKSVRFALSDTGSPAMQQCAAIAKRHIALRSGVPITTTGPADFTLAFGLDATLPPEGFTVADVPEGIRITGAEDRAMLYGLGKFLRTSTYAADSFTPSSWRGTSAPQGEFRAVYAATHFNNFYEAAPAEEVSRYLEDLALWGANTVIITFPTWSFGGFDDPKAQANLTQTRRLFQTAKAIGMKVGIVQCPNQGFTSAPETVRAVPNPDPTRRRGNLGVNCCPSTPEGTAYLCEVYAGLFAQYKDIGLDYLICWPYDEGGCGCKACAPWGAHAFPSTAKAVAAVGRETYPDLKAVLSTWVYDTPPAGEWEGLRAFLEADATWLDAIMCDDHFDFPRYPLDHGVPAGLPLYNFPEISMWGRGPWGAFGANPLPARFEGLWKQTEGKLSGGMPYSEGIYEDINKAICFQFYWDRDITAEQTLREYAAFEFGPSVVDDVVAAVRLLEAAWAERGPKSEEAFGLLEAIDRELAPWAKTAWRWRLLYLRGLIDSQLLHTGGQFEGERLRGACDELVTLYHAQDAHPNVRPHRVP